MDDSTGSYITPGRFVYTFMDRYIDCINDPGVLFHPTGLLLSHGRPGPGTGCDVVTTLRLQFIDPGILARILNGRSHGIGISTFITVLFTHFVVAIARLASTDCPAASATIATEGGDWYLVVW